MNELSLALEAIDQGCYDKALDLLSQESEDMFFLFHRGRALTYLERYDEAKESFLKVSKEDWREMHYENNPFTSLGFISFKQSLFKDAIQLFEMAKSAQDVATALSDYRPYRWSGICYHLMGQFHQAAPEYAVSALMFHHLDTKQKIIDTDDYLFESCRSSTPLTLSMLEISPFFIDLKVEQPSCG